MTLGASQQYAAVICCRSIRLNHARQPIKTVKPTFSRWQSTATIVESGKQNLPIYCLSDVSKYPPVLLKANSTSLATEEVVNLDQTRPTHIDSPPSLDPKSYASNNGQIPISDRFKHLIKIGKSYLTFYKAGFKNVWRNYKQASRIRKSIAPSSLDGAAKYGGQVVSERQVPALSRAQYNLCLRSRHDVLKLIPFSLVFMICGEFTPLVILALGTGVVPYTCRIPQQEKKDLLKKLRRDQIYMEGMARQQRLSKSMAETPGTASPTSVPAWKQEWVEAYRYKLTKFSQPIPIAGQLYHKLILRPRLITRCNTMLSDTILIEREGGFVKLAPTDIYEWADRYSLYALTRHINRQIALFKSTNLDADPDWTPSIEEICTEQLKRDLIPVLREEAAYILNRDWTRIKPAYHWMTTYQAFNKESKSPDYMTRLHEIKRLAEVGNKPDVLPNNRRPATRQQDQSLKGRSHPKSKIRA